MASPTGTNAHLNSAAASLYHVGGSRWGGTGPVPHKLPSHLCGHPAGSPSATHDLQAPALPPLSVPPHPARLMPSPQDEAALRRASAADLEFRGDSHKERQGDVVGWQRRRERDGEYSRRSLSSRDRHREQERYRQRESLSRRYGRDRYGERDRYGDRYEYDDGYFEDHRYDRKRSDRDRDRDCYRERDRRRSVSPESHHRRRSNYERRTRSREADRERDRIRGRQDDASSPARSAAR
eukprot:scaffold87151_cov33-Tisochrysis_lutea.AAC.2